MSSPLDISVGQFSDKGIKEINQDACGAYLPKEPQLSSKGFAIALADGISSSKVSQIASETAVKSFLEDYFSTSETWSVKKSAQCVLNATNAWLYSQTRQSQYRYDKDKGYVCTFSAMVIKSSTAYIFHIGDARIYRLNDNSLEQLTNDHREWVSQDKSYLSQALGIHSQLEMDYLSLPVNQGDIFILATDGVYEYASESFLIKTLREQEHNLEIAAEKITQEAYSRGSTDNLTVQIIKINSLPDKSADEFYQQLTALPFPPVLDARMKFDGYTIIRNIHSSSRSHLYLALDQATNQQLVIKIPSIDLRGDPAYLERFLLEEWIAKRINSPYVLKLYTQTRQRHFIYISTEFIEGQTLTQWMIDNPQPNLETVRDIAEQIAKGLRAFHRLEMLHQDLRPENIMIDHIGTVKIIDFGSTRVAGLEETHSLVTQNNLLGTALYTAPEYFLGENGTIRSDIFSLAVITYQMLSGRYPYGVQVAKSRTKAAQKKLKYHSVLDEDREIPAWIDDVLQKALNPNPFQRYSELSEFIFDLRHPNKVFLNKTRPPLIERNPVVFWKSVSFILALIIIFLLKKLI